MSDKPGLEIFLGFVQDQTDAVSGKNPILAAKIIVHEKYVQENGMVTDRDRQRDRETERQRDKETQRQIGRETERQRDRETDIFN